MILVTLPRWLATVLIERFVDDELDFWVETCQPGQQELAASRIEDLIRLKYDLASSLNFREFMDDLVNQRASLLEEIGREPTRPIVASPGSGLVSCLQNLVERGLIRQPDGDHMQEIEDLLEAIGEEQI